MIKAIIVDVDGVIRHIDIEIAEELAQSIGFSFSNLMNTLWDNDYGRQLLCGKITRSDWWKGIISLNSQLSQIPQDFVWTEVFDKSSIDWELVAYIRKVGQSRITAILTNCDSESKSLLLDELNTDHPFDYVISSSDVGAVKPEKGIYLALLQKVGIEADQCMFFDDSVRNVESARDLGIEAFVYKGLDHLRKMVESFQE
jgi:putative hydrolase of the HAD superfamily